MKLLKPFKKLMRFSTIYLWRKQEVQKTITTLPVSVGMARIGLLSICMRIIITMPHFSCLKMQGTTDIQIDISLVKTLIR